jgi:amino acid transporter
LFFLDAEKYSWAAPPAVGAFSLAVSQLFVAFTGFELGAIAGGEVRDPRRNVPFAILTAFGVVVVVYILVQVVCIGTLPTLASSDRPLAEASSRFLGPAGAIVITGGALISCIGAVSASLLAGSRLPFAMAEQHELPPVLAATHRRFHTPHASILLHGLLGLVLALSGTFTYVLSLAAISKLLTAVATCAALPVLRTRSGDHSAAFRAPAGLVASGLALAACAWLLASSAPRELRDVGIAVGVGLLVQALRTLRERRDS